jgi:probable F420-dependent oxidoreductase
MIVPAGVYGGVMDLGINLPTSGKLASPANIVRVAQEAERLGYGAVWTYERVLRPIAPVSMGGGPPQPVPAVYHTVYEPLETLSFVAAHTERVKLGTSVVDALFHPPAVLARRFATLDQFSGGRVIAGLGQGWMPQEFETTGVPLKRIGSGMDDHVAAMRACWGPDPVGYEGRFYRIAPSEVNPKPVQPSIPILLGSVTPAGAKRAARIADGLNPIVFSYESLIDLLAVYREAATAAGRDLAALTVAVRANVPLTREPLTADRPFLGGSATQIAEDIGRLAGAGVDHVLFANTVPGDKVDDEVRLMEELRAAVPVSWRS